MKNLCVTFNNSPTIGVKNTFFWDGIWVLSWSSVSVDICVDLDSVSTRISVGDTVVISVVDKNKLVYNQWMNMLNN